MAAFKRCIWVGPRLLAGCDHDGPAQLRLGDTFLQQRISQPVGQVAV